MVEIMFIFPIIVFIIIFITVFSIFASFRKKVGKNAESIFKNIEKDLMQNDEGESLNGFAQTTCQYCGSTLDSNSNVCKTCGARAGKTNLKN